MIGTVPIKAGSIPVHLDWSLPRKANQEMEFVSHPAPSPDAKDDQISKILSGGVRP